MTAIDSEGALAPAIGANRIGSFSPKRRQNDSARDWTAVMGAPSQKEVEKKNTPSEQPYAREIYLMRHDRD
jgi:hypothetical protein